MPSLRALRDQGKKGEKRIKFIATILSVPMAFIFALAISHYLARQTGLFPGRIHWFTSGTFFSSLWVVCLVTLGGVLSTGIVNWITRKGIGPGESVVLLAGASLTLAKQLGGFVRETPILTLAVQRLALVVVGGAVALFMDLCVLFSRSIALVACQLFKAYLYPASASGLSEALLVMLYGGREAYQHRNELYKLVKARGSEASVPDLALPEWDRFLRLARQLLDAPVAVQSVPLILREVGFAMLDGDNTFAFAKSLCAESPQAARFSVLIADYLAKAARLPPEFAALSDKALIPLQPVK